MLKQYHARYVVEVGVDTRLASTVRPTPSQGSVLGLCEVANGSLDTRGQRQGRAVQRGFLCTPEGHRTVDPPKQPIMMRRAGGGLRCSSFSWSFL